MESTPNSPLRKCWNAINKVMLYANVWLAINLFCHPSQQKIRCSSLPTLTFTWVSILWLDWLVTWVTIRNTLDWWGWERLFLLYFDIFWAIQICSQWAGILFTYYMVVKHIPIISISVHLYLQNSNSGTLIS